jgi:DNA-binding MarR family transcriptional regulator
MNKSVGRLVSILYRKNQVYLNQALKPLDITATEMSSLLCLYHSDGVTQDEMSHYLLIDKAAISRAIVSLLDKGLIIKEKDDIDKRANRIYLSIKGKQLETSIRSILKDWNDLLIEDIDPKDVETMFHVLEKMVLRLEVLDLKPEGAKHD